MHFYLCLSFPNWKGGLWEDQWGQVCTALAMQPG